MVAYSDIWEVGADRGRCTLDAFWESERGSAQWKMSMGILEQKKKKPRKNNQKRKQKREREEIVKAQRKATYRIV